MPEVKHKYVHRFYVKRQRCAVAMEELREYGQQAATNPQIVAAIVRRLLADEPREHFVVLYADTRLRIIGFEIAAVGGDTSVTVDPRCVFRGALLAGAEAIFVAHNHPSGDPSPSALDNDLTRKLVQAGETLGVRVLDHVVVGESTQYSYADHRRM